MQELETRFRNLVPAVDYWSLRYVRERHEIMTVRQDVPEPFSRNEDAGVMITIATDGGSGYAATCNLTDDGLRAAIEQATAMAELSAGKAVVDYRDVDFPVATGDYVGPNKEPWTEVPTGEKYEILTNACATLKIDPRIVDWHASVWHIDMEMFCIASNGTNYRQTHSFMAPSLQATANEGTLTQVRSLGSLRGMCGQGGREFLARCGFFAEGERIASEAIELLSAANCPTGTRDLVLASDQMMLQIHESIGHPLEIDRILGDERNYAGTSFVTPDMVGSYQYGSELLNVTFDPSIPEQFASYGFDDEGVPAHKEYIIKDGILQRGLGSCISQQRSGLAGVANSRACSWNRPPIDRMANLNVEPGNSSLDDLIGQVELGVYMENNRSWSIDDSRNKFQFGCEYGRMIRDGKLAETVRNPNYRGISATFWRSLKAVGDAGTFGVFGTPFCGKGEPNQVIRVGHASPACLFANVDVFGGDE